LRKKGKDGRRNGRKKKKGLEDAENWVKNAEERRAWPYGSSRVRSKSQGKKNNTGGEKKKEREVPSPPDSGKQKLHQDKSQNGAPKKKMAGWVTRTNANGIEKGTRSREGQELPEPSKKKNNGSKGEKENKKRKSWGPKLKGLRHLGGTRGKNLTKGGGGKSATPRKNRKTSTLQKKGHRVPNRFDRPPNGPKQKTTDKKYQNRVAENWGEGSRTKGSHRANSGGKTRKGGVFGKKVNNIDHEEDVNHEKTGVSGPEACESGGRGSRLLGGPYKKLRRFTLRLGGKKLQGAKG